MSTDNTTSAEPELQRYGRRLQILHQLDLAILAAQSVESVAAVALRYLRQLLIPCLGANVMLFNLETNEATILATSVRGGARLAAGTSFALDAFDLEALRKGKMHVLEDIRLVGDPAPVLQALRSSQVRSITSVPLIVQGELVGALSLASDRPGVLESEWMDIVRELAHPLAIAIQQAELIERLQAGREQLRQVTRQIISAQEEERYRIARELHDGAGQSLTALKISLKLVQADLPPESLSLYENLQEAISLVGETEQQVRLVVHGLRPPALDILGLNLALEDLCYEFARRTKLVVDYAGADAPVLPGAITINLYRILQEALTNVAKHAQASHVWVTLHCDSDRVTLSVEDDGRGFDPGSKLFGQPGGVGLLGMRERLALLGGSLEIEAQPGRGTRLMAQAPWAEVA
jgi:signal transduction histidine kinase